MAEINIADGSTISYKVTGDLNKPTIILVNGSIFNYKQFNPVLLPALKKNLGGDYSYLQYDYVGISKSSELKGEFDFMRIAKQHVELLDALGIDRAHHFGYSKGSLISFLCSMIHPEKVLSIAGYGSPNLNLAGDKSMKDIFNRRRQLLSSISGIWDQRVNEFNFSVLYDTMFLPLVFPGKSVKTLSIKEKVKNKVIKSKFKPLLWDTRINILDKLYRYYTLNTPQKDIDNYIEAMKSLEIPVLLLHAINDETVPIKSSEKLHSWLINSKLIKYENYGHIPPALIKKIGSNVMRDYSNFIKSI